jgi:hypothetical protein
MLLGKTRRENAREHNCQHKIAMGNRKATNAALTKRAGKMLAGFHARQK